MKIYLYLSKKILIFNLPESISGSYSFDADDTDMPSLINVDAKDGKWCLFSTDDCTLIDGNEIVKETELQCNKFYVITRSDVNYLIYVTDIDEYKYVKTFNYSDGFELNFDDNNGNVSYNCPYIKNISFSITSEGGNAPIIKISSANLYVNRFQIKNDYVIKNGDEVELYGVRLLFINKLVIVIASDDFFSIKPSSKLIQVDLHGNEEKHDYDVQEKSLYDETDYFSKSPRLRRVIEEKDIEFSKPPEPKTGGELPFILTLGPMLTMGVTSVVMLADTISKIISGLAEVRDCLTQLVSGSAMLLSSILWPVLTKLYNSRVKNKNEADTVNRYNNYLADKEKELLEESKLQSDIIKENVISLDDCLENLKHRKLNFWDKRIDQSDFLVARIGVGNEKLKAKISETSKGFEANDSEIRDKAYALVEKYKYIENVPIGYSFYENSTTAIMGDSKKCHDFVNNVLFQLLTFYGYDDLKIVVFTNNENEVYWDYIKYLNHNMTNNNLFRFFASNEEDAGAVIDYLKQEMSIRLEEENKSQYYRPYYLIVVDDLNVIRKNDIVKELSELTDNIGFSSIIIEKKLSRLPSLCNNFICLGDVTSGVLKNSYEEQEQQIFKDEINPNINMMEVAKILSNIPIDIPSGDSLNGELPEAITFLEMEKVGKVEQLNILNRWNTNDSTTNLKAEVGVDSEGKLMYLDLHEKAHGPHGLIAGMTGSGKSEFIITWILSLCMNFSPDDVAFILIDYKGGGLAFAFENKINGVRLPHLTGTITNLDKSEIDRTLVSIDSEVKRRQKIFNEARDKLGESTIDIYKYQEFYHDGKLDEPLPHLFIVCDEFAELKDQQPDFMDNLISVARIGRSLGVHLILATQKPSGVVNAQIWSNTKFRVCLKVQDASDSNEMLKKPDAASLKQTGRFYLQVGYDEYYALGQSGWCGAKYYPSDTIQKTVDNSINILNEVGISIKNVKPSDKNSSKKAEADGEQLSAVMGEIITIAEKTGKFAKRLWLENIPDVIIIDDIIKKYNFNPGENKYKVLVGEYDAPEMQKQFPFIYDILGDGSTILLGRDSEESEMFINAVLYNVLKFYKPSEITYYILDFGSQNFVKHRKSPHCGGVVTSSDKEEYNNLLKLISEETKRRKKILSEYGAGYDDYINENPEKMPIMLIVFNGYESITDFDNNIYESLGELVRDSVRYGIVYLFVTSGVGSIPSKVRQLIPNNYLFKLNEPSDYSYCFNTKEKKVPKDVFCRGICKNDGALHEFQIAFINENRNDDSKTFMNLFDELHKKDYEAVLKIPSLPDQIMLDDVKGKLKDLGHLTVGIQKNDLKVKFLDLTSEGAKLVLSSKQKYLNKFIKFIIVELQYLKTNIVLIDPYGDCAEYGSSLKNYFNTDLESKLEKIVEFTEKGTTVDTVIVINSLSKLVSVLSDNTKLIALFNNCSKNDKLHILIFDQHSKLKTYSYEEWYKKIDMSEGVYIGPGVDEQNLFRISGYSRELSERYPLNYGFFIAEGAFSIIKLIEFEKIGDELENDD